MAGEFGSAVSDEYMHTLVRDKVYSVCNGCTESQFSSHSPYGNMRNHHELIELCKACHRDISELESAVEAFKNAAIRLKQVTNMSTAWMRGAIDSYKPKSNVGDV
jgi:hypothetical protein